MRKLEILFFLLAFLIGACATVSQKAIISPSDLSLLKGKWEGSRDISLAHARTIDSAEMEIFNDSIPLKGRVVVYFLAGSDPRRHSFENGVIDADGNLSIQLTEINKVNLSLYREGEKIKLDGHYWHRDNVGRLLLYKK